ncbi:hypothetical protein EhV145_00301 [Emiliania huxleyi virus 145]|nr:hypothetical protein EhV145_00301 [Emiliania huxleyi virus 145]AHA55871.1 hypothetical protein EhV164_00284 [Emiliania huxleyi virus 164]
MSKVVLIGFVVLVTAVMIGMLIVAFYPKNETPGSIDNAARHNCNETMTNTSFIVVSS